MKVGRQTLELRHCATELGKGLGAFIYRDLEQRARLTPLIIEQLVFSEVEMRLAHLLRSLPRVGILRRVE